MQEIESAKLEKVRIENELKLKEEEDDLNKKSYQVQEDQVIQLQKIVDQLKDDVNEEKNVLLQENQDLLSESSKKLDEADELFKKISKNLNKLIDDSNQINLKDTMFGNRDKDIFGTDEEDFLDSSKLDTDFNQLKIDKDMLLETENEDQNEQLKSLEDKIAEKLNKASTTNLKLKGSQIKIKIITLDPNNQGQIKTLTEEETNGITSLITSLFESDKDYEKLKKSKSNYEFVYDSKNIDKLDIAENQNENTSQNSIDDDELNQNDEDNSDPIIFY